MRRALTPSRWPWPAQVAALALAGLLLLPWVLRAYEAWWSLAFRPGHLIEHVMPRTGP